MKEQWLIIHQRLNDEIESKLYFIKQKEKNIDLTKSDKYNKMILTQIKKAKEFIELVLEHNLAAEDLIDHYSAINKQENLQNTLLRYRLYVDEIELKKYINDEYRTIIKSI